MAEQIFGIDYGSKLAGTSVVARYNAGEVSLYQSEKKKSADDFILQLLAEYSSTNDIIALDAPLSLPRVYSEPEPAKSIDGDFHYRACDREVNAMSPLFLGGLTARAMYLNAQLKHKGLRVYEVYPKMVAHKEGLAELYNMRKKEATLKHKVALLLAEKYEFNLSEFPENLHALDALLALAGGMKIKKGQAAAWGNASEGLIYG